MTNYMIAGTSSVWFKLLFLRCPRASEDKSDPETTWAPILHKRKKGYQSLMTCRGKGYICQKSDEITRIDGTLGVPKENSIGNPKEHQKVKSCNKNFWWITWMQIRFLGRIHSFSISAFTKEKLNNPSKLPVGVICIFLKRQQIYRTSHTDRRRQISSLA